MRLAISRGSWNAAHPLRRMSMLGKRPMKEWIAQYELSHQNPINRWCHTIGIPLIVGSLPLFALLFLYPRFWPVPTVSFLAGWILQFVGHAVEGKRPEFMNDARFLLVGLRWWLARIRGRL
jgi:uncharacterized membrane protein YGL010W